MIEIDEVTKYYGDRRVVEVEIMPRSSFAMRELEPLQ